MLLQLHPGLMIWTIVTFVVLVIVLRAVAWKPILGMLKLREDKIRGDIENAETNRKETEAALANIKNQLEQARKEANETVAKSRASADKVKDDMIAEAKDEANKIVVKAKADIELEREKTAQALKEQFAELAVLAAGQIIGQTLKPEEHTNIIRKTIGEIK